MEYIDEFIDKMQLILSDDLVKYVITNYIFLPENKAVIRKQKMLKHRMQKQLLLVSNTIYIDDNYFIYWQSNRIIIHNHGNQDYNVSVYHCNTYNDTSYATSITDNSFLLTSSNMIVNGTEFDAVDNLNDLGHNSSNLIMYIMYV